MQTSLPETGFLRLEQVLKYIPVGKTSWWAGVKSGRFPPSIKLGPRTTAWRVEDIRKLIDQYPSLKASQTFQFQTNNSEKLGEQTNGGK